MLVGALLLSRRAFYALAALAVVAASVAFALELTGITRPRIAGEGWSGFAEFLVILVVFATLGRYSAEVLFGTHPTTLQRIGAAVAFREQAPPAARRTPAGS